MPIIESLIKPHEGGVRTVHIHGVAYKFQDIGGRHFCAAVHDDLHASILLAHPTLYRLAETTTLAPVAPVAAAAGEPSPVTSIEKQPLPPSETVEAAPEELGNFPPKVIAEAADLVDLTIADLRTAVGKVSSIDVLRAALQLEKRKTSARAGAVSLLTEVITDATTGA